MALGSTVELDFFHMEKEETAFDKPPKKLLDRKRSFRDIQGVISKINPEVVKAVIASCSANYPVPVENSPKAGKNHQSFSSPLYSSAHQTGVEIETAPMTIFYNGAVFVFDIPHLQAENILKVAQKAAESNPNIKPNNIILQNESMPRKKSLRRFFEKRRERQINTGLSLDGILSDNASLSSQNASSPSDDMK